jgi:predicted nucleic-acid-binding Zn-ribbon protein
MSENNVGPGERSTGPATVIRCPKCNVQMLEGWTTGFGTCQTLWVDGKPRKSFWRLGQMKVTRKNYLIPVTAYRCSACGYLEVYAK